MRTQIRKIGNSLGNIIPAGIIRQLNLEEGAEIEVQTEGNRIIIEPVMKKTQYEQALGYWTIGIQYLHLVEIVANETIQQGNKFVVVADDEISLEQYDSQTKWSDHNLVVPLLFDFYHGVEVLLKGFLVSKGKPAETKHKLSDLLNDFNGLFPGHNLYTLLSRYVVKDQLPEPLASFCLQSSISIDDYYQALKYPESTKRSIYSHMPLKYRSDSALNFFKGLVNDIKQIRLDAVALGSTFCV